MTAIERVQQALRPPRRSVAGIEAELLAVVLSVLLAVASLREFLAPDYMVEILPAVQGYRHTGIGGWIEALPGYPAAAMLEFPVLLAAELLGLDDAGGWRLLSSFAVAVLCASVLVALPLVRAGGASRTATLVAVALAVGSPATYWALRIGHPEEVLSTGLLLAAAVAAARERPVLAGVLLACAGGKGWAAVAALPVLALLLPQWRRVAIGTAAAAVTTAILYVPPYLFGGDALAVMANTGAAAIFNTGHVFWWFGDPIALSAVAQQPVPQPRIGAHWTGVVSHPLILGVGTAIGLTWAIWLHDRLAALRAAGKLPAGPRSLPVSAELLSAALLVMAGALYARCYLDTWNVPYYLLPGLVIGAIGEAMRGRVPLLSLVATGMMFEFHPPSDPSVRTEPDVYTAMYLAWAIPISVAYVAMGLAAVRRALSLEPEPEPAGAGAAPPGAS